VPAVRGGEITGRGHGLTELPLVLDTTEEVGAAMAVGELVMVVHRVKRRDLGCAADVAAAEQRTVMVRYTKGLVRAWTTA
jgi:3,4-dihydroxy-2-butanone 4-phosphate synthase